MIIRDIKKLDISYIPEKILCREKEIDLLNVYLKSGRAIISGGVGTGKTLLAKHYGDLYVNCYMNRTEHRIVEEIIRAMKPNFNTAGLSTSQLWKEVEGGKLIILDEIDGMLPDELRHFAYTISRMKEKGEEIEYIAITRSANILKQIINDDAIWSTFADKAVVHLKNYEREDVIRILEYRAGEAIRRDAYDEKILSLIADIVINSPGHMRTGIDVLRNSALLAEQDGADTIMPEHVRMANEEGLLGDLRSLSRNEAVILMGVAASCMEKPYANIDEIKKNVKLKEEEYGISIKNIEKILDELIIQDFIYKSKDGYTILNYPCRYAMDELRKLMYEGK